MLDFDRKERERATFTDAVVTEIGFPALDAASKDAFVLTVRIAPERVERKGGSGASEAGTVKGASRRSCRTSGCRWTAWISTALRASAR